MSKVLSCLIAVVIVSWANPAVSQTRVTLSPEVPYSVAGIDGHLTYPNPYMLPRHGDTSDAGIRSVLVYMKVQTPAPLWCLDHRDFKVSLVNADGRLVGPTPNAGAFEMQVPYANINTGTTGCAFSSTLRRDAVLDFAVNMMYPDLQPGNYRLKITLAPRIATIPSIDFPVIRLHVTSF